MGEATAQSTVSSLEKYDASVFSFIAVAGRLGLRLPDKKPCNRTGPQDDAISNSTSSNGVLCHDRAGGVLCSERRARREENPCAPMNANDSIGFHGGGRCWVRAASLQPPLKVRWKLRVDDMPGRADDIPRQAIR